MSKTKEFKIGKRWFHCGYSFTRVAISISVDKYSFELDLVFFWFGWEW